jgi:CheY-like chemotaxis protein
MSAASYAPQAPTSDNAVGGGAITATRSATGTYAIARVTATRSTFAGRDLDSGGHLPITSRPAAPLQHQRGKSARRAERFECARPARPAHRVTTPHSPSARLRRRGRVVASGSSRHDRGVTTVLVVEDDADIRQLFADVLEADGYRVLQAGNGGEALDLLRAGAAPALILLDLMMPVMSGAELLEILQHDPELARVPVVVVSAFAEGTVEGVKRFVQKPVTAAQLQEIASAYAGP